MPGYRGRVKEYKRATAKRFRKNPAAGEAELWERLEARKCGGLKFRRQALILGWIADFYCPQKRLVVEVDGGYHQTNEQRQKDQYRDWVMHERHGITVVRFSVEGVISDLDGVVESIKSKALALPDYRSGTQRPKVAA